MIKSFFKKKIKNVEDHVLKQQPHRRDHMSRQQHCGRQRQIPRNGTNPSSRNGWTGWEKRDQNTFERLETCFGHFGADDGREYTKNWRILGKLLESTLGGKKNLGQFIQGFGYSRKLLEIRMTKQAKNWQGTPNPKPLS